MTNSVSFRIRFANFEWFVYFAVCAGAKGFTLHTHVAASFGLLVIVFYCGSDKEAVVKQNRWFCFCLCGTLGRAWLLATRGASPVAAVLVCIMFAIPVGGRSAEAAGTRGRWYGF